MDDLLFPRPKRTAACLSRYRLAMLALPPPAPQATNEETVHLTGCAACSGTLVAARADADAASAAPFPGALAPPQPLTDALAPRRPLTDAAGPRRRRAARPGGVRALWLGCGTAVALAAVFLLAPRRQEESRTKGPAAVTFSVLRQGALLAHDVPLEGLPPLRGGDRLRLRVGAGDGAYVTLEGREPAGWGIYHAGPVPPDGWLPVAVAVTPDRPLETELRVTICAGPGGPSCREQRLPLPLARP